MRYPVSQPNLTRKEKDCAYDAIGSGWISSKGSFVPMFENKFSNLHNADYGVSCNSGTSALYIALRALGVGKGDEVIVPEFTMIATAWAVTLTGAEPVFVDCDDNLLMKDFEDKINRRTKAVIPVHIYGRFCNMKKVNKLAKKYNLSVLEDSAEAHSKKLEGDIASFSLFGNKIITTGEGGINVTNSKKLAEEMEKIGRMYFDEGHTFLHKGFGFNMRMTNVQAAIGVAQLERMDEILKKRSQIEEWYNKYLPKKFQMPKRDVLWMYDIKTEDNVKTREALLEKGIDSRLFFKPMSMQPMYKKVYKHLNAYKWSRKGLYLPTYVELKERDVEAISNTLTALQK